MGIPRIDTGPMTLSEFYAFTDTRPDDERWELIDGEPVMNASPSFTHQVIVSNVVGLLKIIQFQERRSWIVLPSMGIRIAVKDRPEPDIIVRPKEAPQNDPMSRECDDAIVVFEILSPSTADRDLRWKRKAYASLDSVTDYVVIAQDVVEVAVYERKSGFAERRLETIGASLELPAIGVTLALADIYRDTGLHKK
ncbi:MAG: Uma2 family endonuclease [Pseudorhodoplanes sp.]|uniref:Uma2 family endonuclease n=1 Tax=Pseudorhodoplanes sp. TaxID=1934341 RepID=UPI003D0A6536